MAISLVTSNQITANNSGSQQQNAGTGTNRVLVVGAAADFNNTRQVSALTYAGVSLVQAGSNYASTMNNMNLYYLINPAAGTNTLTWTRGSSLSTRLALDIVVISSNSRPIEFGQAAGGTGNTNPATQAITTFDPSMILSFCIMDALSISSTTVSGQTILENTDHGDWSTRSSYHIQSSAGTRTMSEQFGQADHYSIGVISFHEEPIVVPHSGYSYAFVVG